MKVDLLDKFNARQGTVFLTGIEAIVRLILDKQRWDQAEGHVNQTYISGYEGSPLGGLDMKVVQHLALLNQNGRTVHQFGINEKTAASAMLGTQYAPEGDVDAFWYGKAHGTMWIPDEVWLANLAGTGRRGSMVLLSGEDHRSKSSVSPGSSDWVLRSSAVPTFYPASVGEILQLGRHAIALSRYCGLVTALKLVTPVCDGASTVDLDRLDLEVHIPEPYAKTFNPIVMATGALPMQREVVEGKLPLAEAYIRLNGINRIVDGDVGGPVGLITTGKSLHDLRQALAAMGLRLPILHLGAIYPLDNQIIRRFGQDKRWIYVIEEPGPFVEEGVKAALLGSGVEGVFGHFDEEGRHFIPAHGEVDPEELALRLWPKLKARLELTGDPLDSLQGLLARAAAPVPPVTPMSCGGCPYNRFRDLKEKPGGAIGCSSIRAIDAYDNGVLYIPTMGAGGSIYSGTAPFNGNNHIFQYLGDGSYFHSGRGAVQSCVQGEVNITFLLLYNGAVALTGGQQPGGQRTVEEVCRELLALGVERVGVVSERLDQLRLNEPKVELYPLEKHSEALARFKGLAKTTVLILDKECATEKGRRQRRQGIKPAEYIIIDEEICEGCGDCYQQSEGCAALYSVETEFGEKTQIRQANCAQDELCVDGECPAFVSVKPAPGGGLRRRQPQALRDIPEPDKPVLGQRYVIFANGRGGTGVVTISHLLAYAAMMEGKYVYLSNNTGLAQKGGPVEAPIVLSAQQQPVFNRLFPGEADLYLGFDLLRAAEAGNLRYASPERSTALVSSAQVPTASINRSLAEKFPEADYLIDQIDRCTRKSANTYLDSFWLSERLFADTIYANMVLLGAAYQAGTLPLGAKTIEKAIELNGKAVENNIQAFRWGRLAVADPGRVEQALGEKKPKDEAVVENTRKKLATNGPLLQLHDSALARLGFEGGLKRQFSRRIAELGAYQNLGYAQSYVDFIEKVWQRDREVAGGGLRLTGAVVQYLYKLMAYKDEYEVARLALRPEAETGLSELFEGKVQVYHRLNPPTLRWTGWGKLKVGPWFRPLMRLLVGLRRLRGTAFDPFGKTPCRRLERELVSWYRDVVERLVEDLNPANYNSAVKIANAPDEIRGYEEVKLRRAAQVRAQVKTRLTQLQKQK